MTVASALLLGLLASGCLTPAMPTVGPAPGDPLDTEAVLPGVRWLACEGLDVGPLVDLAAARRLVPATLHVEEAAPGRARLDLLVATCSQAGTGNATLADVTLVQAALAVTDPANATAGLVLVGCWTTDATLRGALSDLATPCHALRSTVAPSLPAAVDPTLRRYAFEGDGLSLQIDAPAPGDASRTLDVDHTVFPKDGKGPLLQLERHYRTDPVDGRLAHTSSAGSHPVADLLQTAPPLAPARLRSDLTQHLSPLSDPDTPEDTP